MALLESAPLQDDPVKVRVVVSNPDHSLLGSSRPVSQEHARVVGHVVVGREVPWVRIRGVILLIGVFVGVQRLVFDVRNLRARETGLTASPRSRSWLRRLDVLRWQSQRLRGHGLSKRGTPGRG